MEKIILTSSKLPGSGPYSAGVEAGGFIFLSGLLPINPETGEIILEVQSAARQILENLKTILEENGLSLTHVVKTTLFLKNMADFAAVNEIYAGFFPNQPPARSTIEISALPKGAPLEIEAIAMRA